MKFHGYMMLAPLALALASCGGDPLVEDIKEFNALGEKVVGESETQETMQKLRAATTNEERAAMLGEYASATREQAKELSAFKADTPEMKAISEKITAGMNKAADGAAAGQKAMPANDQSAAMDASRTMNEGFREFQAGSSEMRKLARDNNVSLSN